MTFTHILRIPAFRRLWLGQAISQVGDALYYIVFMFMVKRITGSNAMVGYVGAVQALPYLVLSPYAGVLADRLDRRRIMLFSDSISGVLLLVFGVLVILAPSPPVSSIFAVSAALSLTRVFFMPAKSAAIPALVPADALLTANALSATTQSVMPLLSLAFSATLLGALYALSPAKFFFTAVVINSVSFLVSALFITLLPPLVPDRSEDHTRSSLADARAGIGYLRRRHELKVLLVLATIINLAVSPFFVVYVAANDLWFAGRPEQLAYFEMAFFAGMIAGSLLMGRVKIHRPGIAFVVSSAIVGATVAAMAVSPHVWLFVLWNLVAGVALPFSQVPMSAYVQGAVEDAYRGRVSSVFGMLQVGVQPIGLALGGALLERMGVVGAFAIMGGGMGLAALAGLLDTGFRTLVMPAVKPAAPVEELVTAGG